jgi:hypothetical protein
MQFHHERRSVGNIREPERNSRVRVSYRCELHSVVQLRLDVFDPGAIFMRMHATCGTCGTCDVRYHKTQTTGGRANGGVNATGGGAAQTGGIEPSRILALELFAL